LCLYHIVLAGGGVGLSSQPTQGKLIVVVYSFLTIFTTSVFLSVEVVGFLSAGGLTATFSCSLITSLTISLQSVVQSVFFSIVVTKKSSYLPHCSKTFKA
jgi:hypothetical protein